MRWKMTRLHKFSGTPRQTVAALSVAVRAANQAGIYIREGYYKTQQVEEKGHGDLVSQIDVMCDHVIQEAIRAAYPEDSIISEELNPDTKPGQKRYWAIDPLDGTAAYVFRTSDDMPSVMIALCDEKGPLMSVVYFPMTDDLFYAIRGQGSFRGRKRLQCRSIRLATAWVEMNQYSESKYESNEFKALRKFLRQPGGARLVTTSPPHSGVGVRIAEGDKKIAAVIHDNGSRWLKQGPWDVIPVALIIEEAGGVVMSLKGKRYNAFQPEPFLIAGSKKLANEILNRQKIYTVN